MDVALSPFDAAPPIPLLRLTAPPANVCGPPRDSELLWARGEEWRVPTSRAAMAVPGSSRRCRSLGLGRGQIDTPVRTQSTESQIAIFRKSGPLRHACGGTCFRIRPRSRCSRLLLAAAAAALAATLARSGGEAFCAALARAPGGPALAAAPQQAPAYRTVGSCCLCGQARASALSNSTSGVIPRNRLVDPETWGLKQYPET